MATYENPTGTISATADNDLVLFNQPLTQYATIDALEGVDRIFVDRSQAEASSFEAATFSRRVSFMGTPRTSLTARR